MYLGSLNLSKISEAIKSGELEVFKSDKGVNYLNIAIWVNEEPNEFGQHLSISQKNKNTGVVNYIGNCKLYDSATGQFQNYKSKTPLVDKDDDGGLPF